MPSLIIDDRTGKVIETIANQDGADEVWYNEGNGQYFLGRSGGANPQKLGIIDVGTLRRTRAYAVIAIAVFAAVIAPTPDVFTLLLLAGPMYLLYESCIWIARIVEKRRPSN